MKRYRPEFKSAASIFITEKGIYLMQDSGGEKIMNFGGFAVCGSHGNDALL